MPSPDRSRLDRLAAEPEADMRQKAEARAQDVADREAKEREHQRELEPEEWRRQEELQAQERQRQRELETKVQEEQEKARQAESYSPIYADIQREGAEKEDRRKHAAIVKDHDIIMRFIQDRHLVDGIAFLELEWSGPSKPRHAPERGRLYRLDCSKGTVSGTYQFYLLDNAVTAWQRGKEDWKAAEPDK